MDTPDVAARTGYDNGLMRKNCYKYNYTLFGFTS